MSSADSLLPVRKVFVQWVLSAPYSLSMMKSISFIF
jgi:hypothetical protein